MWKDNDKDDVDRDNIKDDVDYKDRDIMGRVLNGREI